MEITTKRDTNYSHSMNQTPGVMKISSNESFTLIAPSNELINANNSDMNAAASLSDDSGVPLTTNSSISSGDSYKLEMCKFGTEVNKSN